MYLGGYNITIQEGFEMNYTTINHVGSTGDVPTCFMIPHGLDDFASMGTRTEKDKKGQDMFLFHGILRPDPLHFCPECRNPMHVHNTFATTLRHLPFGPALTFIRFTRKQYKCPCCMKTVMEPVSFRSEHHRITKALEKYAEDLLEQGYTNKEVSSITGLGQGTVKDIDLVRLRRKYTESNQEEDGTLSVKLKKPDSQTKFLIIDEFKLHDNYKYATHIIDGETGHILWIAHGKKKQVVYDFIDHVGMEWMNNVQAVACDMNSDFQEAFEERCEWIQVVFDHFHIVKNFNDKVVSEVRKDEQKRLQDSGDIEGAKALKKTKYILSSKRRTLQLKDKEAGSVISKGSSMFNQPEVVRHGGYEKKYDELLEQNELLLTLDIVKDQLAAAYTMKTESKMAGMIDDIIDTCRATHNSHFAWFANLLESHYEGIIAHATYCISSGKIEGVNNKIKTLRRQGYGYPDDDYFFLKCVDASYRVYERNPPSHKISH